jgi:tetratricopeptide (TPR) repeat protein
VAEQHYATGLTYYFDRAYTEAEREFVAAIKFDDQDARFFYFLGLAHWQLTPNDRSQALADFEEAARLERRYLPPRAAVNAALERIQGPVRQELNRFRP